MEISKRNVNSLSMNEFFAISWHLTILLSAVQYITLEIVSFNI